MADDQAARMKRAQVSLAGLSVGDAFGERFFANPWTVEDRIDRRSLPRGPWMFTDDTVMAISVVDVLEEHGRIEHDRLARLFAARYMLDRGRGYGGTAHRILEAIHAGAPWAEVSQGAFGGMGSMGNGGAMRAAPIGAYHHDDLSLAADEARASAEVTHAHAEGQAGAIAVAVAAAWISAGGAVEELFDVVLAHTPAGETRSGIIRAAGLPLDYDVRTAVSVLGNGAQVISQDTVPFCLWCIARCGDSYEEALWTTVSGMGDRDTTCAIVGGVVALHPQATIPPEWLSAREPLECMERKRLGERFSEPL